MKELKPILNIQSDKPEEDEEDMFDKEILMEFYEDSLTKYSEITSALAEGDNKTARRLAHTLKSTSATIGKIKLQKAAADVERLITNEKSSVTETELKILETELNAVLKELKPILNIQQ